jgi:hypothetical protein
MYTIGGGATPINIKKVGDRIIEIEIDGKKSKVNVNDMVYVVKECMPANEAEETFAVVDEQEVKSGKAMVAVKAHKDIKAGEMVNFAFDVTRYLDAQGKSTGVRTSKSGFIY